MPSNKRFWRPLAAALSCVCLQAHAQDDSHLISSWSQSRQSLLQAGIDPQLQWTNEAAGNLSGGTRHTARTAGQLTFGANLDLDRLWGWSRTSATVTYNQRYGRDLGSDAGIGNAQLAQEIYGRGQTLWLTQLSVDHASASGRWALRVGRMPTSADFGFDQCNFQNLTFCGMPVGNIDSGYWMSAPVGVWGARLKWQASAHGYVQLGLYQDNPTYGDTTWARRSAWKPISPHGNHGVIVPVEWGRISGASHYRLGAWVATGGGDDLYLDRNRQPIALTGEQALRRQNSYGAYLSLRQALAWGNGHSQWFVNLSKSDHATSEISGQLALGLEYHGIGRRSDDVVGVALGASEMSRYLARTTRLYNALHPGQAEVVAGGYEKAVELYYGWSPLKAISIRPNLQYIRDPGGTSANPNAWVVGLKTVVNF